MHLIIDSVNLGVDLGIFGGEFTSLQDSATYQWMNCFSDSIVPGATTRTFIPTKNGFYAVIVTNSTGAPILQNVIAFGMWDYRKVQIRILSVYIPIRLVRYLTLSLVSLYSLLVLIRVFDNIGREVYVQRFKMPESGRLQLDINKLPPGVYNLKIANTSQRFVKY